MTVETGKYTYDFDYRMHEWMIDSVRQYFQPGNTLEIGCFEGRMSKILFQQFSNLVIVESEIENINVTRSVVPLAEINHVKIENFSTNKRFKNIFLIHTLEHIENDLEVLTTIRRLLDEDGRLFLIVPNANAASRLIAVGGGIIEFPTAVTESERNHGHVRTYDLESLRDRIEMVGLREIDAGGIFFKALANFQLDEAIKQRIISEEYLQGCLYLGKIYPNLCASIYIVCTNSIN